VVAELNETVTTTLAGSGIRSVVLSGNQMKKNFWRNDWCIRFLCVHEQILKPFAIRYSLKARMTSGPSWESTKIDYYQFDTTRIIPEYESTEAESFSLQFVIGDERVPAIPFNPLYDCYVAHDHMGNPNETQMTNNHHLLHGYVPDTELFVDQLFNLRFNSDKTLESPRTSPNTVGDILHLYKQIPVPIFQLGNRTKSARS
jgi:hypothetical protein